MNLDKSGTRLRLERLLEGTIKEIEAQRRALTKLRKDGMFPHPNKLATATGTLTTAVVKACAELRQQEKHAQAIFDAMSADERNALLLHHLYELDAHWLDRFADKIAELKESGGLLGL